MSSASTAHALAMQACNAAPGCGVVDPNRSRTAHLMRLPKRFASSTRVWWACGWPSSIKLPSSGSCLGPGILDRSLMLRRQLEARASSAAITMAARAKVPSAPPPPAAAAMAAGNGGAAIAAIASAGRLSRFAPPPQMRGAGRGASAARRMPARGPGKGLASPTPLADPITAARMAPGAARRRIARDDF